MADEAYNLENVEEVTKFVENSNRGLKRQQRLSAYMKRRRRTRALHNGILMSLVNVAKRRERSVWCKPRNRWWARKGVVRVSAWPNEKFLEDLRMSRESFLLLCTELAPLIAKKHTNFRKPVSVENRLAITIWRLATNIEYRSLGNLFGIGTSTAGTIVREVCGVITKHLLPKYVTFPPRIQDVLDGFQEVWQFPHCAGAIDGSHVLIISPSEDHKDYFNRKGWHSLILQAVVDYRYLFLDINVGWCGSVHDARVLANSRLFSECEKGIAFEQVKRTIGGVDMAPFLIGDAAYPLLPWMIKPFQETSTTPDDIRHFNYRLSRARMVVENAFGRLKGRFRLLKKQCDCDISTTVNMVSAAVTLHNFCELRKDDFKPEWLEEEEDERSYIQQGRATTDDPGATTDGKTIRVALVNYTTNNPLWIG